MFIYFCSFILNSVNVDARVVKRLLSDDQSSLDMIELENGCVCCGPEAGQLGQYMYFLLFYSCVLL